MITKGDAMIEQLFHMQADLRCMREAVLAEDSVMPTKQHRITISEVKKEVLWYLDLLDSQVAVAFWHMSTVEHDSSLSETDKELKEDRIAQNLYRALGRILLTVKALDQQDYGYHMDMERFMQVEANNELPPFEGRTREEVFKGWDYCEEALRQLWMVRDQVADMLMKLGVDVR
jgi:hypothetical protein